MWIPGKAVKCWTPIATLNGQACDTTNALHQQVRVPVGKLRSWSATESQLELLKSAAESGSSIRLKTPKIFARYARVPIPDTEVDGEGIPDAHPEAACSHVAHGAGVVTYRFTVGMIVECLRLMWDLKNVAKSKLDHIVSRVWRMTLTPEQSEQLINDLQAKRIVLPQYASLHESSIRIDIMYSLYLRQKFKNSSGHLHLTCDASPQGPVNIFCARATTYSWPQSMSAEEVASLNIGEHRHMRHLPMSALGYKASTANYKAANLIQKLKVEVGTTARFDEIRLMVRSMTTDQGAESFIVDMGAAIAHSAPSTSWARLMKENK